MSPIFNPDALAELYQLETGGAEGLVASLFIDYKEVSKALIEALHHAAHKQDLAKIELESHSLKSSSRVLGLEALGAIAEIIEYGAHQKIIKVEEIMQLHGMREAALIAIDRYHELKGKAA